MKFEVVEKKSDGTQTCTIHDTLSEAKKNSLSGFFEQLMGGATEPVSGEIIINGIRDSENNSHKID